MTLQEKSITAGISPARVKKEIDRLLISRIGIRARFTLHQLREQVLITKNGAEPLSSYPFEEDWL
jgi:hypothetical protein